MNSQKRRKILHTFLCASLAMLCQLLPLTTSAANSYVINETTRTLKIDRGIEYHIDQDGQLTLDDLQKPEANNLFKTGHEKVLNLGITKTTVWVRFKIQAQDEKVLKHRWLLQVSYPHLSMVNIYQKNADGKYSEQQLGRSFSFKDRRIQHRTLLAELEPIIGLDEHLYLRVYTEGSLRIPLTIWQLDPFLDYVITEQTTLGLYYGIFLVIVLYNLFLFLTVKDINFLYYIIYVASMGIFQAVSDGSAYQYLWPDNPYWAKHCVPFFIGVIGLSATQFTRTFLNTMNNSIVLDRTLKTLMLLSSTVIVGSFLFDYQLALKLSVASAFLFVLAVMAVAITGAIKRYPSANYFLLAWTFLLICILINVAMIIDLLPSTWYY